MVEAAIWKCQWVLPLVTKGRVGEVGDDSEVEEWVNTWMGGDVPSDPCTSHLWSYLFVDVHVYI